MAERVRGLTAMADEESGDRADVAARLLAAEEERERLRVRAEAQDEALRLLHESRADALSQANLPRRREGAALPRRPPRSP